MSNSEHKDYLLFIAQDTVQEIRDTKKNQRDVAYSYFIIVGVLFGLFGTLKSRFGIQTDSCFVKVSICIGLVVLMGVTNYLIYTYEQNIKEFRKRITKIWADGGFRFAWDARILKYKKQDKKRYYSFRNGFYRYAFVYMVLVFLVCVILCLFVYKLPEDNRALNTPPVTTCR